MEFEPREGPYYFTDEEVTSTCETCGMSGAPLRSIYSAKGVFLELAYLCDSDAQVRINELAP